ncbi:polyisoprenoid-binding protein [Roseibium aquae]|uniref:Polyisoprenoid-binding protein n=1 Tax=Roseibium aquae TaxID=1323746 RepID=A0A916THJ6_9HYPH|nr:YceI family protein [Roseibium aquae]GGB43383.1 polyisoprenoid-binding protein [Roseibium aquae]
MRQVFLGHAWAVFGGAAVFAATAALAEPHRYELDPEHTTLAFTVHHLGFADTLGVFTDVAGTFTYDMDTQALSDLTVTVQTASIESFNAARDEHVRNPDFLNVAQLPVMTFTADGGTPISETTGTVTGTLTLLGQSRPLTLDVTLNKAGPYPFGHQRFVLGISARTSVKRSDFGMTYAVAGDIVGDQVDVIIETEAMRIED